MSLLRSSYWCTYFEEFLHQVLFMGLLMKLLQNFFGEILQQVFSNFPPTAPFKILYFHQCLLEVEKKTSQNIPKEVIRIIWDGIPWRFPKLLEKSQKESWKKFLEESQMEPFKNLRRNCWKNSKGNFWKNKNPIASWRRNSMYNLRKIAVVILGVFLEENRNDFLEKIKEKKSRTILGVHPRGILAEVLEVIPDGRESQRKVLDEPQMGLRKKS